MDERSAAHHEAAHAVVAVRLGLPLQDFGIHLDTIDGGIAFNLHRVPGDPNNAPKDINQRERSIVAIKAGYRANLKLNPHSPPEVAADDRKEEIELLNEMYSPGGHEWAAADARLRAKAQSLVDEHWNAIAAVAQAVLAKPVVPRSYESRRRWKSPDPDERFIDGYEIAAILKKFGLNAIVRKESDGNYIPPDLNPI